MPTQPRRWPLQAETEREQALQAAENAAQYLQQAQQKIDTARERIYTNPGLAALLVADSDRQIADAMTQLERLLRFIAVASAKPLANRWPMGVVRQRDDALAATQLALDLLGKTQESLVQAREKVESNHSLAEMMLIHSAASQARAHTQVEYTIRMLTEAALGRE